MTDRVQIPQDALRIFVSKKYVSVRRLDMDNLVAPNIGARATGAANTVAAEQIPRFGCVALNLRHRNGAQAKTHGADLNSGGTKAILKSGPGKDREH